MWSSLFTQMKRPTLMMGMLLLAGDLVAASYTVSGRIVDNDGVTPKQGVNVSFARAIPIPPYGYQTEQTVATGADGTFSITANEGPDCRIGFSVSGPAGTVTGGHSLQPFTANVAIPTYRLPRAGTITGRVVRGGQPVDGVLISVERDSGASAGGIGSFFRLTTGGGGSTAPDGTFTVNYYLPAYGKGVLSANVVAGPSVMRSFTPDGNSTVSLGDLELPLDPANPDGSGTYLNAVLWDELKDPDGSVFQTNADHKMYYVPSDDSQIPKSPANNLTGFLLMGNGVYGVDPPTLRTDITYDIFYRKDGDHNAVPSDTPLPDRCYVKVANDITVSATPNSVLPQLPVFAAISGSVTDGGAAFSDGTVQVIGKNGDSWSRDTVAIQPDGSFSALTIEGQQTVTVIPNNRATKLVTTQTFQDLTAPVAAGTIEVDENPGGVDLSTGMEMGSIYTPRADSVVARLVSGVNLPLTVNWGVESIEEEISAQEGRVARLTGLLPNRTYIVSVDTEEGASLGRGVPFIVQTDSQSPPVPAQSLVMNPIVQFTHPPAATVAFAWGGSDYDMADVDVVATANSASAYVPRTNVNHISGIGIFSQTARVNPGSVLTAAAGDTVSLDIRIFNEFGDMVGPFEFAYTVPSGTTPVPLAFTRGPLVTALSSTSIQLEYDTNFVTIDDVTCDSPFGAHRAAGVIPGTRHRLTLENLLPGNSHTLTVAGIATPINVTTPSTADTVAPAYIVAPAASPRDARTVAISLTASESCTATLEYGTTAALGSVLNPPGYQTNHLITLTQLEPDTVYHFRARLLDAAGNGPTDSSIQTFRTPALADTQAPEFVSGPTVDYLASDRVVVSLRASEPVEVLIQYGIGGYDQAVSSGARGAEHQVVLPTLTAGATYQLRAIITDLAGNVTTSVGTTKSIAKSGSSFTTLTTPDTAPPNITLTPAIIETSDDRVVIRWETDEIADSRISWGVGVATDNQLAVADFVDDHVIVLPNLAPSTSYSVSVRSADPSGNLSAATSPISFSTTATSDATPPLFTSGPTVAISDAGGHTIQWSSNEPVAALVEYGVSEGALTNSVSVPGFANAQSARITPLSGSNLARVTITDPFGNSTQSDLLSTTVLSAKNWSLYE